MGSNVSNLVGLFDNMKYLGISAKSTLKVLDLLPEFVLQNRKDLLLKKYKLIKKESGRDNIYLANMIRRHPDLIMKSLVSMETKVNYIQRDLNR
jgi:hypothetical protein